jgi:serine/threonine protein kinase/tetratricopeptide (TPR) repeat protein
VRPVDRDDVSRTRTIVRGEDSQAADRYRLAPAGPQRGDRIGRYVVGEVIGAGGMGVVVAASDPELARQVALKVVRRDIGDRAYRERLVREARAMAQLEHENVVRVYDAGEHDGEIFVAMELVRGETVGAWLRAGPRRWREVLARFVAAGQGLAAAHRAGMIHRDFKPDNVLVRASDGRVCVTDFGLVMPVGAAAPVDPVGPVGAVASAGPEGRAETRSDGELAAAVGAAPTPLVTPSEPPRAPSTAPAGPGRARSSDARLAEAATVELRGGAGLAGSAGQRRAPTEPGLTGTGAVVGTPPYMAPEQHRGAEVDVRADVFSFCVSLYEGLYGERPFKAGPGSDRGLAWAQAIELGRVLPAPRGSRVPAALRRVLLRGLASDPAERWPSMDAVLAALEPPSRRSHGFRLAALAIGVAALAIGIAALVGLGGPAPTAPAVPPPGDYLDGIARLRRYEFRAAAAAFERATAARPEFAPAWVALARARSAEPDLARARRAIARAGALIGSDDRAHRLELEGLAAEIDEKLDAAIDRYQAYFRFFPHDVDAGLALADAQCNAGHPSDALATLHSIPDDGDSRRPLAEAKAAMLLRDWPRTKLAAERAIALGQTAGALPIVARARMRHGFALDKLGDHAGALADLAAAGTAAQQLGDRVLEARQLVMAARLLDDAGDVAGSARAVEAAIAIDREIGEPHNLANDLFNAGYARGTLGELDRAGQLYREGFALLRGLDDRELLSHGLYNYGQLLTDLGQRLDADKVLREAIATARGADLELLGVLALAALAINNFGLGAVKQAEAEWREVTTTAERLGDSTTAVIGYGGTAIALAALGDRAGALGAAEQSVRLAEHLGPGQLAAEQGKQAALLGDAGQYARAAELAGSAAAALHDHKRPRDELLARATAALALAQLGRRDPAMTELALGRAALARPLPIDDRARAATRLMSAAAKLGLRDDARAIYRAAPHDRVALPWASELEAQARRLGIAR